MDPTTWKAVGDAIAAGGPIGFAMMMGLVVGTGRRLRSQNNDERQANIDDTAREVKALASRVTALELRITTQLTELQTLVKMRNSK